MKINGIDVEDTYAEAFAGLFCRLIVTAKDKKRLKQAVYSATSLPSTVFGEAEGGVESWLEGKETPDGRDGAVIQLWVNYTKNASRVLEKEVSKRIRQGILVVPTTRVFNALESESFIDTMDGIGHCGDGYETVEKRFGRDMISIPIMMGDFMIEKSIGFSNGVMGGNILIYCESETAAIHAGDMAVEAVLNVSGAITSFDICAAGSKVETCFPEIGPTTNHPYCPSLRSKITNSRVPPGVNSIPEIVINGMSLEIVKEAMKNVIYNLVNIEGVLGISAGNFNGKLGKYNIKLTDLIE